MRTPMTTPPRERPALVALALCPLAALTLAGCGGGGTTATGSAISVAAADTGCAVSETSLTAGAHRFTVTNKGARTTEFYVYAGGDRIVGEVENIAPGTSRELLVDLPAGSYQATCKPGMTGNGIRTALTVAAGAGGAPSPAADPLLAAAGPAYSDYVRQQAAELVTGTTAFTDAVRAGDVARAQQLYPAARLPWERIEPVAESFGDLDPRIDGRGGDQDPGQDFTGFHRIERALWQDGSTAGMAPYADQLLADVREIAARAQQVTLTPLELANGAKALLDEIASGKITGEEERYSHTDLADLAGNLAGSQQAIEALRPYLQREDAGLLAQLDDRFAATTTELATHQQGTGWVGYDQLSQDQLHALSDRVTALTESASKVAAVVAGR